MKLNDLFLRDRFTFLPEEGEKLGLKDEEKDTVFVVVVKYHQDRILIGDTQTGETIKEMEKREVPGDLKIIPEKGNREGKIPTEKEAIEMVRRAK